MRRHLSVLLIIIILGCILPGKAETIGLELVYKTGETQFYLLNDNQKITFTGPFLCISSPGVEERITMDLLASYRFSNNSGIGTTQNGNSDYLRLVDKDLVCKTNADGSELCIWNSGGIRIMSQALRGGIETKISLEHLAHGVYIVKLNDTAIKIIL